MRRRVDNIVHAMAYSRTLVFQSALLGWQQVRLDAPHPAWSDEFRVDAPCLLMPLTRCFECRIDANRFVCDPASALWLSSSQPYRLRRPWSGQRSALLVVANDVGASRRCPVPLRAHVAMSRWWRQLETNCVESMQIEEALVELVASFLSDAEVVKAPPHRAVERACEYIAAEPQRDAGQRRSAGNEPGARIAKTEDAKLSGMRTAR